MSTDDISAILSKRCRERKSIRLRPDYLKSWLESQSSFNQNSNTEQLYNALVDDFLKKDIGLTSEPVIPKNFGHTAVTSFPNGAVRRGGVVLQLQDTMDISNSAFSLLNKIKNTSPVRQVYIERNEVDDVEFPRGIMRWVLSDGTTQLQAMEMETIPLLDLKTPFGCKILVKSCQVRRGMLLLKRESVEVLGGGVPEMYGEDMMRELELRLKQKLGLAEEPTTPVPEATQHPNTTNLHANVDNMDIFDDDIDYSQLDLDSAWSNVNRYVDPAVNNANTALTTINSTVTPSKSISTTINANTQRSTDIPPSASNLEMFSDDDDFMAPPPPSYSPARTTPIKVTSTKRKASSSTPSTSSGSIQQTDTIIPSQNTPRKRIHKDKAAEEGTQTLITARNTVSHILNRRDSASTEEGSADLSWIDASVWENINKVKEEKDPELGEKNDHYSFEKLSETLKAMEDKNFAGNLPDTVIIRAMCVRFGKMTMSTSKGFYLEIDVIDPDRRDLKPLSVIFNNEMITGLVGYSKEEIKEMYDRVGTKPVVKQIFKPFQNKVLNTIAMLKVDLTVLSEGCGRSYNKLLPLAIGFNACA